MAGLEGTQESGVAGVQELAEEFPREMLALDFRIKTLLAYSATPVTSDS
jgi:hypothetical protein